MGERCSGWEKISCKIFWEIKKYYELYFYFEDGWNTGLLGNSFSRNIWRYCKRTGHTVRKTEN